MNRGQYVAIVIGLVAGLGLLAVNLRGDGSSDPGSTEAAETGDGVGTAATAEPAGSDTTTAPAAADQTVGSPTTEPLVEAPPVLGEQLELRDLDGWLQTDATSLADFDGQVHVVQFWTFSCINCKNTLDNMAQLYERHRDEGFEVIGIHAPEFSFEEDPARVQEAAIELGVTWPIALDTRKTNFREWQPGRRFWPRTFVIDQEGQIRFDRIGEGAYDELNAIVAHLLENGA